MKALVFMLLCSFLMGGSATAQEPVPLVTQVEKFFLPNTDLLQVKLEVDRLSGDTTDSEQTRKQIGDLESSLGTAFQAGANTHDKYIALRHFIYDAGQWNNRSAFSYDLSDPFGRVLLNRFLSHYIAQRKGNCVTMPVLALLLGRKLGLKMTLALAPHHEFIKLTDDDGHEINLEATSGLGPSREVHYREELPMSDIAVSKGTYLRGLSDEELVAILAEPIVYHALTNKDYWSAIKVADVLLKHFPSSTVLLLERGSAYGHLVEDQFLKVFGQDIPREMRPMADFYHDMNMRDFAAAEALGWREDEGQKGHQVR